MSSTYTETFETSEFWRTEVVVEDAASEETAADLAELYRDVAGIWQDGDAVVTVTRELVDSDTESAGTTWDPDEDDEEES